MFTTPEGIYLVGQDFKLGWDTASLASHRRGRGLGPEGGLIHFRTQAGDKDRRLGTADTPLMSDSNQGHNTHEQKENTVDVREGAVSGAHLPSLLRDKASLTLVRLRDSWGGKREGGRLRESRAGSEDGGGPRHNKAFHLWRRVCVSKSR